MKNYLGKMINEIFSLQNPWREQEDYSFDLKTREIFCIKTDEYHLYFKQNIGMFHLNMTAFSAKLDKTKSFNLGLTPD